MNLPKCVAEFEQKNPKTKKSIDDPIDGASQVTSPISDEDMKNKLISNLVKYFAEINYDLPRIKFGIDETNESSNGVSL